MSLFDKTVSKTKYPNGDVRIVKASGKVYEHVRVTEDNKVERTGEPFDA